MAEPRREALWWSIGSALLLTAVLGLLSACYLTVMYYRGEIPRCYVVEGCATVHNSRYPAVLGVPIALPGAVYFALMFGLGIGLIAAPTRGVVLAHKVLAHAGMLVAILLFLMQAVVLRAFCTYCLVTDVILVMAWLASFGLRPEAPRLKA